MKNNALTKIYLKRGNGLDTHRLYETLLMGAIPVVENSTLYPIYKEATILVVENFRRLTAEILNQPEIYINDMSFSRKILYFDTWWQRVEEYRKKGKYLNFNQLFNFSN